MPPTHANILKRGTLPLQVKPATGKHGALSGPSYTLRTRSAMDGMYKPSAENERPFMSALDEFRSSTGMMTWERNKPQTYSSNMADAHRVRNYGDEHVRASQSLHTTAHNNLHFLGQFPGVTPSSTFAVQGKRTLSSKWIPLETKGDTLLYVHPSQREVLQWTQEQLRADAKSNNRDLDAELDSKVDELLQHDPVQPYHELATNRKLLHERVREEIIEQESRLHQRRMQKGLPVPPILLKQYAQEYPTEPGGKARTTVYNEWYRASKGWRTSMPIGGLTVSLTDAHLKRINKRQERYVAELRAQGVEVGKLVQHYNDNEAADSYVIAQERATRQFESAALDPVVESETILSED